MCSFAATSRDYLSQEHGIDVDVLSQKDVIERALIFWSVLQSHTDRFYSYYYIQEKKLVGKASLLRKIILSKESSKATAQELERNEYKEMFNGLPGKDTAIRHMHNLKKEVNSLNRFLEVTKKSHTQILEKYNLIHCEDVIQREVDELEKTHTFWDGSRLEVLMTLIDDCISTTSSSGSTRTRRFSMLGFRKLKGAISSHLPFYLALFS